MGVVHKPDPGWASHIPVLIKALELTKGEVLELGMGSMSTPLLHVLCESRGRYLHSYDNDSRFTDMFRRFRTDNHDISLVEDWDRVRYDMLNCFKGSLWDVALVDQKPAEARKESVKQLTYTDYVIIHDSNDPAYDYESIYPLFKYRYTHEYLQHTTVLSNKHDVQNIFHSSFDK